MSDLRTRLIQKAKAKRALEIKLERLRQSNPRGGLLHFIRYFWHILEPERKFVDGWILEGLCEHLEAITRGEITGDRELTRLLANIPPGTMKSLTVNCFWPAWEWGPMELPHLRYIAFSYAAHLTERDNERFRDIVRSREYKEMWGHVFSLTGDGKIKVSNDKQGFKFASSVGGVGTGERADRVLCLPGDEVVLTNKGWLAIKDVVDNQLKVQIAGFDHKTGRIVWQEIEAHERNPGNEIVEITCEGGSFRCTRDHPVFVQGRGYASADSIRAGEFLLWSGRRLNLSALQNRDTAQAKPQAQVLQQAVPNCGRARVLSENTQPTMCRVQRADLPNASALEAVEVKRSSILQPCVSRQVERREEQPRIHGLQHHQLSALRRGIRAAEQHASALLNKVRWRNNARTHQSRVEGRQGVPAVRRSIRRIHKNTKVLLAEVRGYCSRASNEGRWQWALCAWSGLDSVSARMVQDTQGADQGSRWEPLPDLRAVARSPQGSGRSPRGLHQGQYRSVQPNHLMSVLSREVARQEERQNEVDTKVVRSIKFVGREDVVYNIRVTPCHNYFAGGFLVHNCDDPHAVNQAESDVIRKNTVRWFRETMSNRLNSLRESAIVVIMQRVNEEDVSGAILDDGGYVHYCVPMEYDSSRHCSTPLGWTDPRGVDGELAWPERFSSSDLASFKRQPYLWSGQYQQLPSPRGGGIFKDAWWQVHEVKRQDKGGYKFVPEFQPVFVLASLDTAFTEKEENDYSALTVWAVYDDPTTKHRKILLVDGWKKRLELHGEEVERKPGESEASHLHRSMQKWGLVEWVNHTCKRRRVDRLIVENKARGHDVVKEIKRLYADRTWGVRPVEPKGGDKIARAHAVVDLFTDHMIHAPAEITEHGDVRWLDWADTVIRDMSVFPRGSHDDIVDSATQALKHLREIGLAIRRDEAAAEDNYRAQHKGQKSGPSIGYFS